MLLAMLATGCATQPPQLPPETIRAANELLSCTGKPQCDLYWQRAQAWVAKNGYYKVRLATDTLIETFGPVGSSMGLAFRVTRIPTADGAQIEFAAGCGNMFGCMPHPVVAKASFNRFVQAP